MLNRNCCCPDSIQPQNELIITQDSHQPRSASVSHGDREMVVTPMSAEVAYKIFPDTPENNGLKLTFSGTNAPNPLFIRLTSEDLKDHFTQTIKNKSTGLILPDNITDSQQKDLIKGIEEALKQPTAPVEFYKKTGTENGPRIAVVSEGKYHPEGIGLNLTMEKITPSQEFEEKIRNNMKQSDADLAIFSGKAAEIAKQLAQNAIGNQQAEVAKQLTQPKEAKRNDDKVTTEAIEKCADETIEPEAFAGTDNTIMSMPEVKGNEVTTELPSNAIEKCADETTPPYSSRLVNITKREIFADTDNTIASISGYNTEPFDIPPCEQPPIVDTPKNEFDTNSKPITMPENYNIEPCEIKDTFANTYTQPQLNGGAASGAALGVGLAAMVSGILLATIPLINHQTNDDELDDDLLDGLTPSEPLEPNYDDIAAAAEGKWISDAYSMEDTGAYWETNESDGSVVIEGGKPVLNQQGKDALNTAISEAQIKARSDYDTAKEDYNNEIGPEWDAYHDAKNKINNHNDNLRNAQPSSHHIAAGASLAGVGGLAAIGGASALAYINKHPHSVEVK